HRTATCPSAGYSPTTTPRRRIREPKFTKQNFRSHYTQAPRACQHVRETFLKLGRAPAPQARRASQPAPWPGNPAGVLLRDSCPSVGLYCIVLYPARNELDEIGRASCRE